MRFSTSLVGRRWCVTCQGKMFLRIDTTTGGSFALLYINIIYYIKIITYKKGARDKKEV